ncbi:MULTISPECIES: ATP-grasp domain-containing protein [unclassified Thermosynechococcus]|uniref:ATP-grasp domain-containing protein n=1 Tax=unclassified Thermosynechococcus TaxID=2622553 RepID=UPI002672AB9C|nr:MULTISPECIES: ATP-grasp domain-containing protein [unclassified Thermosynechococcus]WKT81950.1 ATP-grasp domain-containing protein [Thermosynechococcus sp. PP45]WNC25563.1 ATP-grasp domain-containing protein [Thermosynechococcus sp. PP551]WNC28142.1 ATP-grasp domain-containing protein [Thermosynechococcus sp. PP555]WNC30709.1 ATP-grasp domain-containing protein [Thermosynechococcus sp. PKX82]
MVTQGTITIAVGSSGSATGYTVVQSLKQTWGQRGCKIIACDINPRYLVAAASISDSYIQLPSAFEDKFAIQTVELLKSNNVNYFYPIHDQEICATASAKKLFEEFGITILCASPQAVKSCTDKLESSKILSSVNLNSPTTYLLSENTSFFGKSIVKERYGNGSQFIEIINDKDQLEYVIKKILPSHRQYIIQEWIDEPEITIDAFIIPDQCFVKTLCRKRVEIKSGITTKGYIFYDENYSKIALSIAEAFQLFGSFCFQVRGHDNYVIDVNPRIGGATAMSIALGLDFPSAHVAYFLGEDPAYYFTDIKKPCFVTRSYREHISYL